MENNYCIQSIINIEMDGIFIIITCRFNFVSATILGDKDVYIDIGSSLKLTCNVRQVDSRALYPNDPHFIIWKRNNEVKKLYLF